MQCYGEKNGDEGAETAEIRDQRLRRAAELLEMARSARRRAPGSLGGRHVRRGGSGSSGR
jgi:hypothetical protein